MQTRADLWTANWFRKITREINLTCVREKESGIKAKEKKINALSLCVFVRMYERERETEPRTEQLLSRNVHVHKEG